MYKPIIGIVGPSGSGKSTSLRNLDPATTVLYDLELKGFPFRNTFPNTRSIKTLTEFKAGLESDLKNTDIKVIVIDSFTKFTEVVLEVARQTQKGYDIWSYYSQAIGKMLTSCKNDRVTIVFTAIDEIVSLNGEEGSSSNVRRIKVSGKEWEGKIEKEFLIVFYTCIKRDKDGKLMYMYQTNTEGICSAKSPMEMFREMFIPNDLNAALGVVKKYYEPNKPS